MSDAVKLGFSPFATAPKGVLVVFCDDGLKFGPATRNALAATGDLIARAAKAERFTGKSGSAIELVMPEGLKLPRLVVIGTGKTHTVRDVLGAAFGALELDWQKYVVIDKSFMRPPEKYPLVADPRKAKERLGWQARTQFEELIKMMVEHDIKLFSK